MSIEWNILNNTSTSAVDLCALSTGDAVVPASFPGFIQQPGKRFKCLGLDKRNMKMRMYVNCARAMGVTRKTYNFDEDTRALMAANPARMANGNLAIVNRGANGQYIDISCKVTYKVEYFDPIVVVDT